jgi:nitrate reductase assembly molybdenum cofactor insertion protein NarJ
MTVPSSLDGRVHALLREAAEWRLLARLFECPDDEWHGDLVALACEMEVDAFKAAVEAIDETATAGQYYSVFGPGGPAPPREASYHDSLELGSLMSELAGYYDAFAYAPRTAETPDHVATEVGFVAYLKFKEAYAHARGDTAQADVAAQAAAQFVADHLTRIAQPLAGLLVDSHLDYLAHASRLLAARVGPRPQPALLPMLPSTADSDEDGEFECGLP